MSLKKRLGKVVKTAGRAVAAYYTAGASEAALAAAKARKTAGQTQGVSAGAVDEGGAMSVYVPQVQSTPGAGTGWGGVISRGLEIAGQILTQPRTGRYTVQGMGGGTFGGFGLPVAAPGGAGFRPRGMRRVNSSAASYCRRNPSWCSQVGGVGAVANMVASGQLPTVRRGRGRGISGREFRAFRRVHKVLSTFCAPRMKIRRKRS